MRRLLVGFVLLAVLVAQISAQPEADADLIHTVSAGDTLISIAHAYGVTLDQLLTLNDLHAEALLQIGRRLLVIRAPEYAEEVNDPAAEVSETNAGQQLIGDDVAGAELSPAPVTVADAPMRDPADISPRLCFTVFEDANQNGMIDPDEAFLTDATIRLLDAKQVEQLRYTTDGAAEPYCPRQLARKLYTIEGGAPPGFGLTVSPRLQIDLRAGGLVHVDFGAKQGLQNAAIPPPDAGATDDESANEAPRSRLRALSGLFALGLAGVVFCSGMALSLFIRGP